MENKETAWDKLHVYGLMVATFGLLAWWAFEPLIKGISCQ